MGKSGIRVVVSELLVRWFRSSHFARLARRMRRAVERKIKRKQKKRCLGSIAFFYYKVNRLKIVGPRSVHLSTRRYVGMYSLKPSYSITRRNVNLSVLYSSRHGWLGQSLSGVEKALVAGYDIHLTATGKRIITLEVLITSTA